MKGWGLVFLNRTLNILRENTISCNSLGHDLYGLDKNILKAKGTGVFG